jgi:hypothetical protein
MAEDACIGRIFSVRCFWPTAQLLQLGLRPVSFALPESASSAYKCYVCKGGKGGVRLAATRHEAHFMRQGSTVVIALVVLGSAFGAFPSAADSGEPLDDRIGIRTVPLYLLLRSDVQVDLKLAPGQVAEAYRAAQSLYEKALGLRGKRGGAILAARRAIDEDQSRWLAAHLSAEQLERLNQIELQWEGAAAMLSRPVVAEYLNLTAEQKQKVARFIGEARERRARGGWTFDEHVDLTRQAISVLSDKQKELWVHVLGPACRFSIVVGARPAPSQSAATTSPSSR